MELHVEDRDFLYFRTYYFVCSRVHSCKTKLHLTKCQVRIMFTVCLLHQTYMKQYQTHKTRDARKHKVHILYTIPLCNINTGVWYTLSIRIMYLLFHADKLILQVGKAHNLHSTVLLVYHHSWLSRKCSNQCSIRQSRQIPNSIPVVRKTQLTTWNCNLASFCYYATQNIKN